MGTVLTYYSRSAHSGSEKQRLIKSRWNKNVVASIHQLSPHSFSWWYKGRSYDRPTHGKATTLKAAKTALLHNAGKYLTREWIEGK